MLKVMRSAVFIAVCVFFSSAQAEPNFNLIDKGDVLLGISSTSNLTQQYEGINRQEYDINRKVHGVLLAFNMDIGKSNKEDLDETGSGVEKALSEDSSDVDSVRYAYVQIPFSDSASLSGEGSLDGQNLSGKSFTLGYISGAATNRSASENAETGASTYFFVEGGFYRENINYEANNSVATGTLEGSDFRIGVVSGLKPTRHFSISILASYTWSFLEFTRRQEAESSTIEFPSIDVQDDAVEVANPWTYGMLLGLQLRPSLSLNLRALNGHERSTTASIIFSF